MSKRKPTRAEIAAAPALTTFHPELRGEHASRDRCQVCGRAVEFPTIRREHGVHDEPLTGSEHFLVTCEKCELAVVAHPRFYSVVHGLDPDATGTHSLCTPCVHRRGLGCAHPLLKANGGPGLLLNFEHIRGIVCSRSGGARFPALAIRCQGFEEKK